MHPLPDPDELVDLPVSYQAKAIYALLYEHRDSPLTMQQIRERLGDVGQQEQLDRRRRELNRYFEIEHVRRGVETAYRLVREKPRVPESDLGISERDRAFVLRHGRCAMCGRTPLEDGIRLQVDHKIPREWGGTSALENLQPLCEECNRGKKNLFASYSEHSDAIREAIGRDTVHERIGELLKALDGEWVRSDVIDMVASPPGDYQEDWQRRIRELRDLGWDYETRKQRESGRVWSYYRVTRWEPWPSGNIRAAIGRGNIARRRQA
ncbi:MAG TPA: HNH endonuclease [Gaiellaceae bacterium]|nr:HNH endonuclease [Gaiellaceae bacterium]